MPGHANRGDPALQQARLREPTVQLLFGRTGGLPMSVFREQMPYVSD